MRSDKSAFRLTNVLTAFVLGLALLGNQAKADDFYNPPDDYWEPSSGFSGVGDIIQTSGPITGWDYDYENNTWVASLSALIHFQNPLGRGDTEHAGFQVELARKSDGSPNWHDWDTHITYTWVGDISTGNWVKNHCQEDTVGLGGHNNFAYYYKTTGLGEMVGGSFNPGSICGTTNIKCRVTDEYLDGDDTEEKYTNDGPQLTVFKVGAAATSITTLWEDVAATEKVASEVTSGLELTAGAAEGS